MESEFDDPFETDEYQEEGSFSFTSSLSGTLCVVDCSDEMLTKDNETGVSRVVLALEAIKATYCNKLISGSLDHIGVLLCGTDTKTNDYQGLHVLLPLDTPDKTCVDILQRTSNEFASGKYQFGHGQVYSPYHLLWTCSSIYTSCVKKLGTRLVMIFTNVSEPHNIDTKTRQLAATKARDMSELGITISIITLPSVDGSQFDMDKFYSVLVPDHEVTNPTNDIEDLSMRVHRRESKVRMTANINFVVNPELTIGVKCCNLFGESTAKHVNLCSKTNEPVVCVSSVVRETDRSVLLPHEVYRSCKLGEETVIFGQDEVDQMKVQSDKGIYLIGFRPAGDIKFHHVAGKSTFIRPCETVFNGSTDFFVALLKRLHARKMVGMVHCVSREGTPGYIGALLPQLEQRDEDNEQLRPMGFHLIHLPFADDIRKLDYEPSVDPSTAQVDAAKSLVLKLKAKQFSSDLIENPQVLQFNKTLEAIALEKDAIEETEDCTKPNIESMNKRAAKEISQFNNVAFPAGYTIPEDCKKPDYKRVIALVQNRQREGTLSKVTVTDLKLYCKGVRLKVPSTAKKAEVVEAIKKFLG
ncbi:X-ray repair cross-complementing protein 6-like [Bolinopsis microptera]|uniref:X-ray repair cross-complementing protein 6-like n=1 Tax=Bolinopsis microptera TaxID=2820187 RepID=UPI0030797826